MTEDTPAEQAITLGCQDPSARRIVALYATRRASTAVTAEDIEQEAWIDIIRTLRRRHDPTRTTVPKHIAGIAYNAVRTAARNLERRAGVDQARRLGFVRVSDTELDEHRYREPLAERQVLLARIGAVRDRLPDDLAEEVDRYVTGERSLGRRQRRAAIHALRRAFNEPQRSVGTCTSSQTET